MNATGKTILFGKDDPYILELTNCYFNRLTSC